MAIQGKKVSKKKQNYIESENIKYSDAEKVKEDNSTRLKNNSSINNDLSENYNSYVKNNYRLTKEQFNKFHGLNLDNLQRIQKEIRDKREDFIYFNKKIIECKKCMENRRQEIESIRRNTPYPQNMYATTTMLLDNYEFQTREFWNINVDKLIEENDKNLFFVCGKHDNERREIIYLRQEIEDLVNLKNRILES